MKREELLEQVKAFYAEMEASKLDALGDIYHDEVIFTDPVHQVNGLDDLKAYLGHSIENVDYCHFTFDHEMLDDKQAFLAWQMRFAHPKVRDGAEIVVPGVTHITFDEEAPKVRQHIDYYDMGALVYEHVPVMGWMTNKVKARMKNG